MLRGVDAPVGELVPERADAEVLDGVTPTEGAERGAGRRVVHERSERRLESHVARVAVADSVEVGESERVGGLGGDGTREAVLADHDGRRRERHRAAGRGPHADDDVGGGVGGAGIGPGAGEAHHRPTDGGVHPSRPLGDRGTELTVTHDREVDVPKAGETLHHVDRPLDPLPLQLPREARDDHDVARVGRQADGPGEAVGLDAGGVRAVVVGVDGRGLRVAAAGASRPVGRGQLGGHEGGGHARRQEGRWGHRRDAGEHRDALADTGDEVRRVDGLPVPRVHEVRPLRTAGVADGSGAGRTDSHATRGSEPEWEPELADAALERAG